MSGVDIIGALLYADAAVVTAVPTERIKAGDLAQGVTLPAILLTSISGTDMRPLSPTALRRVTERIQVTIAVGNYEALDTVMRLVRHACADKRGTIAGSAAVSVLTDGAGPDFMDDQTTIFMRTQDFIVSYLETA